jgi:prepilin-type N-terminal cleavage/methylation domain-containing protein
MKIHRSNSMRGSRGFTLLEVVLALGMVAVLAVSLYTSLHIAFGAQSSADAALEPPRTAELALDFIQNDFQNSLPPNTNGQTYNTVAVSPTMQSLYSGITTSTGAEETVLCGNFEGIQAQGENGQEADDVVFFSTVDAGKHIDANGEIKQIEYAVQRGTDGQYELVRRIGRNLISGEQIQPDQEVLCRGVSSFTIAYSTGSEWQDTWDSTQEDNDLPAAVQITLVLERPGANGREPQTHTYSRIITLPCSTAALDPNVNSSINTQ